MGKVAQKTVNHENRSVRRILEAALAVWSRDGYHGSSLQEIADEAGVAKSLLHYHFASKEHMLIELEAVHSRALAQAVRARLERSTPSVEAALDALDQVWDGMVATRHQFPFVLEVCRARSSSPALRARLVEFDREITNLLRDGILRSLGPLAGGMLIPPDRMADLLHVAFAGFSMRLYQTDDVAEVRRTYDDFKLLVRSILPTAPAPRRNKGVVR
jgi:AcrR family transcriptional regulator